MTTILMADDHPMIQSAVSALLADTDFEIVACTTDGTAALEQIEAVDPDLVILDVQMPKGSGIHVLRTLRGRGDRRPVILLTASIDDDGIREAIGLAVSGILLKNSDPAHLLACLEVVRNGGVWIDEEFLRRAKAISQPRAAGLALAPRERDVIQRVRRGLRNKDIAAELGVTEGTVKVYLHGIFEKLGVGNRTELALRANEFMPED